MTSAPGMASTSTPSIISNSFSAAGPNSRRVNFDTRTRNNGMLITDSKVPEPMVTREKLVPDLRKNTIMLATERLSTSAIKAFEMP
jgi:hypothetical protein